MCFGFDMYCNKQPIHFNSFNNQLVSIDSVGRGLHETLKRVQGNTWTDPQG